MIKCKLNIHDWTIWFRCEDPNKRLFGRHCFDCSKMQYTSENKLLFWCKLNKHEWRGWSPLVFPNHFFYKTQCAVCLKIKYAWLNVYNEMEEIKDGQLAKHKYYTVS